MSSSTVVLFFLSISFAEGARVSRKRASGQVHFTSKGQGVDEAMGRKFFQEVEKNSESKKVAANSEGKMYFMEWYAWFKDNIPTVSDELHAMMKETYHEMNVKEDYVDEDDFVAWFMAPHKTEAPLTNGDVFFSHKEVAEAFLPAYMEANVFEEDGLLDKLFKDRDGNMKETIHYMKFHVFLRELNALEKKIGLADGMVTNEDLNKWRNWWTTIDAPPKGPRGVFDREQAREAYNMWNADREAQEPKAGTDEMMADAK